MNSLTTIILIVFAVLQIILFFKLWIMANNVSKIKERQDKTNLEQMMIVAALYGNAKLAQNLIEKAIYNDVKIVIQNSWHEKGYFAGLSHVINKYIDHCDKLGIQMPDVTKYEDWNTAKILFGNITK